MCNHAACPYEVGGESAMYNTRSRTIADTRTHTHTEDAQYPSSKAPHINHTGVSRTCRQAPPSHIYGQYLVIKARAVSLLSSQLPLGEEALHTSRHIPYTASTHNTKPHNTNPPNIRRPVSNNRIPQIAPLFDARYDRSRTTYYQLPGKTANPKFH